MCRIKIKDDNVEVVLAYLCGKLEMDSSIFYKFKVDEKSQLENLF